MIRGVVIGDAAVKARLEAMPQKIRQSLVDAMKVQWMNLQRFTVKDKLSGQVLNRVTGVLASSINVGGPNSLTEFSDAGSQIVGRVGTRVVYGKVHEYGGTFQVKSHERKITQAFGKPIDPKVVVVRPYTMHVPERSFLRSTLRDHADQIRGAIQAAVSAAMK